MKRALIASVLALLLAGTATAANEDEPWQKEIEKKLAKKVSFNFQETTLTKALDFFRDFADLNIVLDTRSAEQAEKRFTLKLGDVRVESGIAWTARLMALDYAVRDEAVFLARRDDMPVDWRAAMQERYRRMVAGGQESWLADIDARLERTIKVDFRNDHLPAVLDYLATQSGLNIVLDYHLVNATKPIKLQVQMSVKNILNWVARLAEVKYVIRDEVIYVADRQGLQGLRLDTGESPLSILFRRPVTFHFRETPIRDALGRLSRYTGVQIELQGLAPEEKLPVTVSGERVELNRALRMVMDHTKRPYAISYSGKSVAVIVKAQPEEPPPEGEK